MPVSRSEVLRLYKNLLHYSKKLSLTDPVYFRKRITTEFRKNQSLTTSKEIDFAYKRTATVLPKSIRAINQRMKKRTARLMSRIILLFAGARCLQHQKERHYCIVDQYYNMLCMNRVTCLQAACQFQLLTALKHTLDFSKVPKIKESDLTESFVRGSGPGGSAVNKNSNCVVLTHVPTGTVIKCHTSRCQDENRKMARELLVAKLDELFNGSDSVASQKKRLEEKKYKKTEYKKKKKALLKSEWKKREGLE